MDTGTGKKGSHILILEDDRVHQDLALRAFRDDPEPFRLSVAGTIKKAREVMEQDPPGLIIADWIVPDGKGLDILPRIDGKVTTPLVIMTSHGDEHLAVEVMKSGAIDYVVKSATMFGELPHIARRALRDWENIRERVRAEEAERDSEKRLSDIIGFLPDAMLAIDNEGRVIAWNSAIEQMTGVLAGDMIGKGDHEYSIPFYGERRPILIDLILKDDPEIEKKYLYVKRDGPKLIAEVFIPILSGVKGAYLWGTATPLYDSTGNRIGAIEVIRDITERKRAEEFLRQQNATLETLLNAPLDVLALLDRQGTIIRLNREGIRQYGGTAQAVIGRCVYDLLPPDLATERKKSIDRVFETGEPVRFDDEHSGKYLDNAIYPVFNADHTAVEYVAVFATDITDRKRAELALQASEERFRHISGLITDFTFSCIRPPDGVFSIDWVTGPVERITGFSADEIIAMGCWRHIVVDEDQKVFDEKISGLLPGMSSQCDLRIRAKDGALRTLLCFVECTGDPASTCFHRLYGGCQDITDQKKAELALQESETRFRDLFNNMGAGVAIYEVVDNGGDFVFRDFNRAAETIDHLRKDEVIGQSLLTVFPGVKEFGLFDLLQRVARTGIAEQHPVSLYQDNRISGWRKNYVYKLPSGEIVAIYEDVTEQKLAEERLRESETRFRALIQNSSDIIRVLDRDSRIIYESPSAERILGYPPGYMIGREEMENVHPDDIERVKNDFRELLDKTNPGTPTEFRIRKADGTFIWVDALGTNLLDVPGVNGIVITTRPIQQRKEAEQALRQNEARLATAMDIARLVNWEFDVASGMFTFDDRFYSLYGTTADREGGNLMSAETYMQEFVYPDDRPVVLASIRKILATTDPDYYGQTEHRIISRDGGVRTIIARFAPIMGPDGKVIRTYGANQDITDFKLMESEIRSLNSVLEQRVRDRTEALQKANEALEEEITQRQETEKKLQASYDEKVMLLKEIHHRVKNNLQIITSLLNLQSRYVRDEQTLAAIRESQNRVKAMALVHEKLYRADDIAHISLHDYIRFLGTGLFKFYDARSRGIQFTLDITDVNVDIDAAIPLGLIINELISNSLKYAFPEGRKGEIFVGVKKDDHSLTILYRDTGIGIPADLDWRDTQSLGLRLVNTLVDQMNGTIELDRTSGTRFTMVLYEKEQRSTS